MISLASAQVMTTYQWEKRVVILLTDNESDVIYQKQLDDLKSVIPELDERKILVIRLTPDYQTEGLMNLTKKKPQLDYTRLKSAESNFEIILLGLDGYSKLQQSYFLPHQDLFNLIDRMPMRRYEIDENPKKKN